MYRTTVLTNLLSMWVNLPKVGPAALVVPETQVGGTVPCGAARGGGDRQRAGILLVGT